MVTRRVSTTVARFEISSLPRRVFHSSSLLLSLRRSIVIPSFFFRETRNVAMHNFSRHEYSNGERYRERIFGTCWPEPRGKSVFRGEGYNLNCKRRICEFSCTRLGTRNCRDKLRRATLFRGDKHAWNSRHSLGSLINCATIRR